MRIIETGKSPDQPVEAEFADGSTHQLKSLTVAEYVLFKDNRLVNSSRWKFSKTKHDGNKVWVSMLKQGAKHMFVIKERPPSTNKEKRVVQFLIPDSCDEKAFEKDLLVCELHTFAVEMVNKFSEGTMDKAGVQQAKLAFLSAQKKNNTHVAEQPNRTPPRLASREKKPAAATFADAAAGTAYGANDEAAGEEEAAGADEEDEAVKKEMEDSKEDDSFQPEEEEKSEDEESVDEEESRPRKQRKHDSQPSPASEFEDDIHSNI